MAKVLNDTTKKTLLMLKTPTGKYKIAGMYRKTTEDGDVYMLPHENGVFGSIGRAFDDIEYLDTLYANRARNPKSDEAHYLEYGKS